MKSSQEPSHEPLDDAPVPPEKSMAILLLKDIGDVTWRLFVPFIGMTLLGWVLDKQFAVQPWGVIAGMIVGLTISGILIRNIYKKI